MPLGIPSVYVWVAVLIAAVAIEAFTLSLTSIWFGFGALAALISASFDMSLIAQIVIFVIVSALLLVLVRPFSRKFLQIRDEKTNADRIIGQTAIVTIEIDNTLSRGEVKLMGQSWTARSADGAKLAVGCEVRVLAITGVKAIVERLETYSASTETKEE